MPRELHEDATDTVVTKQEREQGMQAAAKQVEARWRLGKGMIRLTHMTQRGVRKGATAAAAAVEARNRKRAQQRTPPPWLTVMSSENKLNVCRMFLGEIRHLPHFSTSQRRQAALTQHRKNKTEIPVLLHVIFYCRAPRHFTSFTTPVCPIELLGVLLSCLCRAVTAPCSCH